MQYQIIIKHFFIFGILVLLAINGFTDEMLVTGRENYLNMTLDECLNLALNKNLDIRMARENVIIAESIYRVSRAITTPDMTISGSNLRASNETESDSASVNLTRYITTGGSISANIQMERSVAASLDENYSSSANISFSQPLLKGRGGRSVEATEKGLEILDEEIEITRTLQDIKRSLIHNVTSSYYRLIGALRNIVTAEQALENAERLLHIAQIRREEGIVAKIDVTRAEVHVATRKANLISVRRSYETSLESFIELLGLDLGMEFSIDTSIEFIEREINLDNYINKAFENRLDWRLAKLRVERSDISLRLARLNRLPQLDARVSYGASQSDTDFDRSWNLGDAELSGSLTWSIPLWQSHTDLRESYIQSISSKNISEISLENKRRDIILEIRQAVIAVEEAREKLDILSESIKQAEESLYLAQRSYEEGLQTYLDVLDAQISYTNTKNNYTNALISYLVDISNLDMVVAGHSKL